MNNNNRPVVPIPPSYDQNQELEIDSTIKYIKFLDKNNIETIMTTAGTSQFNLLTKEETILFNQAVVRGFSGNVLVGVPPLSQKHTVKYIKDFEACFDHTDLERINFLILYPDRFYNKEVLVNYFTSIRQSATNPIYIHGNPIRNGKGGNWDYRSDLINELGSSIIAGLKEECSDLKYSYNFIQKLDPGFDIIVAGGSIRRYEFLKNAGANAFLSGVGNFFPKIELEYFNGERAAINVENNIFEVFMSIGWHASLRYALKHLGLTCLNDRQPWPNLTDSEKIRIMNVLKEYSNE